MYVSLLRGGPSRGFEGVIHLADRSAAKYNNKKLGHTHPQDLAPIPPTPGIVEGQMTSTWTHLSGGQSGKVRVCPALLNRFAVGPSDTLCIIKRILCLTRRTMGREMEFRNEIRELQVLNIEIGVVFGDPLEMVN